MRTQLVGREREMAVLHECLEAALSQAPRIVLCRGESGIGKTRLAEEALGAADSRGAIGVWGRATESAGAPPYWLWRHVLRALEERVGLREIADRYGLTADLAGIAPDVFVGSPGSRTAGGSSEERFLQFDAFARLLRQVSAERPLVIALDDTQWADQASILLLQHIAHTLSDERLMVVVNHRDTERTDGAALTELVRGTMTREIHLRGLSAGEVGRQLASMLGDEVDARQVEYVHGVTGGNPFFVKEVGRALTDRRAGEPLSPVTISVREAIGARLERLSPRSVEIVRAASVVGREFSPSLVAAMLEVPLVDCLSALDEAASAGLLEPASIPDEPRFVHALIRDAVEDGLHASERVRLHRRAAETIEQSHPTPAGAWLFDLARHWSVAAIDGDRSKATRWIGEAAHEAMRQLAYEDAARLFRRALDIGGGEVDEVDRCRLLLGLAGALYLSSDIFGGLDACVEAASLARAIRRPDLVAEAALVTPPTLIPEADLTIRKLCEQARELLGPEPPALAARVSARFAETCEYLADGDGARRRSQESLALAEACNDPVALMAALRARQLGCSAPDGLEERASLAERMIEIGLATDDAPAQLSGHLWLIDVAFERGDLTSVARGIEIAWWLAQEVRSPLGRWDVLRARAVLAQAQARFDVARRFAIEAFDVLAPTGHPIAPMMRGALLSTMAHQTGHDQESLSAYGLADASANELDFPKIGVIRTLAPALVLIEVGRLSEAAGLYRSLGPATEWQPSLHSTLPSYAFGIAAAVALDASEDVATLREVLQPHRGHHVVAGAGCVSYFGPVELWLGVAARHLGLFDDAVVDLEQAVRVCSVNGIAGFHAEAQYELALALSRRGNQRDFARARSLVADSAKRAIELGTPSIATKAQRLMAELDAAARSPRLTPREREVADLVAQGLTNREIAKQLFLSERTAQNHVQHILTKLDLSNRSQIAVWATSPRNEYAG
jgi:DNA-binding CsgD family transcriptional regulator